MNTESDPLDTEVRTIEVVRAERDAVEDARFDAVRQHADIQEKIRRLESEITYQRQLEGDLVARSGPLRQISERLWDEIRELNRAEQR